MALHFYNTLTRTKEAFTPITPGKVGLYTCGPTIYNYAHIGNLRAYMFEDLLKRYLQYRGYSVHHVMNLTDVEDKLIRTVRETGEPLKAITGRYGQAFFEDLKTLNIVPADIYPAATGHIAEMVAMIKSLREKGHTYESGGSIYFKLDTYPAYGQLSHMDIEQLQSGGSGRVDSDEYERDDVRDFALWKAWTPEDGEVYWETELGKGRPGWHIECSAMATKYLGDHFDIHCGGVDNIFPHHENEIAQSCCATGAQFVNYWLHCAHLVVNGQKMSKSLGNFFTLRDLLEKGIDPMAVRWVLVATHYRQPNNFSFDAADAARESLRRIRDFRQRLGEAAGDGDTLEAEVAEAEQAFQAALDDDLNISGGLAAVFEFIRAVNAKLDRDEVGVAGGTRALALLDRLDTVTGLFAEAVAAPVPQDVLDQVQARQDARRTKDFAAADAIRDALLAEGWVIEDTPNGARVKRAV